MSNVTRYKGMTVGALSDCVLASDFDAVQKLLTEAQTLLAEARNHIRPFAVLAPESDFAKVKGRIDTALLYLPLVEPINRVEGCADAAWLFYDRGLGGEHYLLVMHPERILSKAAQYAGYKPQEQVQQP